MKFSYPCGLSPGISPKQKLFAFDQPKEIPFPGAHTLLPRESIELYNQSQFSITKGHPAVGSGARNDTIIKFSPMWFPSASASMPETAQDTGLDAKRPPL
jgi:hypothetical protein